MERNTFAIIVNTLRKFLLHCISIVILIVFIIIVICICCANMFIGIVSGFLLYMLWKKLFKDEKRTAQIKEDEKQQTENCITLSDTDIKTNNQQNISETEPIHNGPSAIYQPSSYQDTRVNNSHQYHIEPSTNNLSHSNSSNPKNQVVFLTHSDIEQIVLTSEFPIKLIAPEDDSISVWETDYGYNKNDINYWTHTEIKNSYRQIRKKFLNGIYYDLSSPSYNLYWKILVYDVTDAMKDFSFKPSFCAEIFSILNTIADNDHKLLKTLAETYISPRPTIKPNNLDIYKAIITKNPFLAEEKSWITLQMIKDISYDSFCKLHQIRYLYWFGFNIHKAPTIKQYLTSLYLNVLALKSPSNNSKEQQIYEFHQDEYRICQGILQLCFDAITHYFHDEALSLNLPDMPVLLRSKLNNDFPNGICACIESELNKLLPLSKEAWQEIYHYDTQLWRPKYELIRNHLLETKDYNVYLKKVDELYALASKAPNIYLMLADVIKRISKNHTEKAIIYYFNARLIKNDTKIVKSSIQHLFPSELIYTKFEKILEDFKQTNDYNKALENISKLYKPERKKINISETDLQKKEILYKKTVSMLDNIMGDDENDIVTSLQQENTNTNTKKENLPDHAILTAFIDHNLVLTKDQIKQISCKFNIMPSVMIDSINERYYDIIDDILIEYSDNQYSILPEYINIINSNE